MSGLSRKAWSFEHVRAGDVGTTRPTERLSTAATDCRMGHIHEKDVQMVWGQFLPGEQRGRNVREDTCRRDF